MSIQNRILSLVLSILLSAIVVTAWIAWMVVAATTPSPSMTAAALAGLVLLGASIAAAVWVARGVVRMTEQRVAQAQRAETLARLVGGVAHEFNNLLGVVSNSAHLLRRSTPCVPGTQLAIDATLRAVDSGSRLCDPLLRIAGREPLSPRAVDLKHHLATTQDLNKTLLGKRAGMSLWVAPGTLPVTVDPSELDRALVNLIGNAADAVHTGGHVWVTARNAGDADATAGGAPAGNHVIVTVTDDGAGIAEGPGLNQVQGFCRQAGGAARLESTVGLGTSVSMLLPAHGRANVDPVPEPTRGVAQASRRPVHP